MRFKKIWWGSWKQLGELCEVLRCLLGRGLRHHCPMYDDSYILYLIQQMFLFFILHCWICSRQTLYVAGHDKPCALVIRPNQVHAHRRHESQTISRNLITECFLWYIWYKCFILKVWEWHAEFSFIYGFEWITDKTEDRKTLKDYYNKAFLKRKRVLTLSLRLSSNSTFFMKLPWSLQSTMSFSSSEPL